jgi:hypothetical protein
VSQNYEEEVMETSILIIHLNLYSASIRKYKQWQEAEFTVTGVQRALMRLPVNQEYEEREGLASVTISHDGTDVFVGSGFTAEERLRYAANPSLILGKEITVQCELGQGQSGLCLESVTETHFI